MFFETDSVNERIFQHSRALNRGLVHNSVGQSFERFRLTFTRPELRNVTSGQNDR